MKNNKKGKKFFVKVDYLVLRFCDIKENIFSKKEYNKNLNFLIKDFKMKRLDAQILMNKIKIKKMSRYPETKIIERISQDIVDNYSVNDLYPISENDFRVLFR